MQKKGKRIGETMGERYREWYMKGYMSEETTSYGPMNSKLHEAFRQNANARVDETIHCCVLSVNRLKVLEVTQMWLMNKKPYVKLSTYAHYLSVINAHINNYFGGLKISEINEYILKDFTVDLLKTLKTKTVRDILNILSQILDYAFEQGFCGKLSVNKKLPKDVVNVINILSLSQQKQFVNYLNNRVDLQKLGILICLYTGVRLGEICGLRWEDIDLENKMIKVRRTVQRIRNESGGTMFLIDVPKTQNSIRDIPLPQFLVCHLDNYKCSNTSAYVLTGTLEFTQPRTYQNRFKAYLKNSGLIGDYHFHTLRHTFASRAIEAGFDPKTLSEILGHSNVNITLNRYVHSSLELKRRNMELLQVVI